MAGNEEFLATLPEPVRGDPALRDIADVGALATSYVNGQRLIGEKSKPFAEQLPETIRNEGYFAELKDLPSLATRAFEQSKLLAAPADQLVELPGPDDAEGWGKLWNRVGRPEAPDKYQLADPEKLPDGLSIDPEGKAAFAKTAHELGLTQKQAAALYGSLNGDRITRFERAIGDIHQGIEARETALKAKWGAAFDQKTGDLNLLVDHLSRQFNLGDALRNAIEATPGDSGIAVKEGLAEAGALMREHKIIGSGGTPPPGALAPAEALQQINAMMADPAIAGALRDQHAPGHADAVAKMTRLYEFAHPEPGAQAA